MNTKSQSERIRAAALNALSRCEQSNAGLRRKLLAKDFEETAVDSELARLRAENLLSDERFSESYVYAHVDKGQGPLRLRQGLRRHGVDEDLARARVDDSGEDWLALARRVREKRFGPALPGDPKEYARQARFLSYRGFTPEQVRAVLKGTDLEF